LIAVDSSVAIAAFASWHDLHERALDVLDRDPLLPSQAALETYSVLTRLPPPLRVAPEPVVEFLDARFPAPWPALDGRATAALLAELRDARIAGGATYDAVIAVTARENGATLVSCDVRAAALYDLVGVEFELVG
jgi:predicted nucleic acid-binding protein